MIKINLLPVREAQRKEKIRKMISIGALSLTLLIVVLGFLHMSMLKKINSINSEIDSNKVEISLLTEKLMHVKQFEEMKQDLEKKIKAIDILNQKKTGPVRMLDEISKRVPLTLWLTSLQESNLKLSLDGIASDNETIARFMKDLEESRYFSNIELIQSNENKQGDMKLAGFKIACNVELP